MKFDATIATNRELDTEYRRNRPQTKFEVLAEMTKRVHRQMVTPDIVQLFRQYKLNGAGNERH